MASYNRVVLMGNITRDIELRHTPNGTAVTDVGVAINDRVKRNGEWVEETTFVECTLWGRTAEVANQYLSKGSPIFLDGRLRFEQWETDGQKRSRLKVVCERLQLLPKNGKTANGEQTEAQAANGNSQPVPAGAGEPIHAGPPADDDIPF